MKSDRGQDVRIPSNTTAVLLDWNELGGAIASFDCVQMKDDGAAQVQARVAGMTLDQELEYWRQRSAELK